ncbi:MAG: PHP domain-containing protein [Spirochaetaceae bacterium]
MKSDIRVDIHIHTRASDGVWTPEELAEEAEKEGIELFAATDHNSTGSVARAREEAVKRELYFLEAVEIDTTLEGSIYHILGYDIDTEDRSVQELLAYNKELQQSRDIHTLEDLEKRGFPIDWEDYRRYEHDPSRGGWKLLNFCIDRGFCDNSPYSFSRLFDAEHPIPHPQYRHPAEAVKAITGAGGIPVLAHPYGRVGGSYHLETHEVFRRIKEAGVRGLECYTPYHSEEMTADTKAFCNEHGLLITGGSDSHGSFTVKRKIGRPFVTAKELRLGEIAERAGLPASKTT